MERVILKVLESNEKFILNLEEWSYGGCEKTEMVAAYGVDGGYIGGVNDLLWLVGKRGIKPERINKESNACSIGFSEDDQKWYGWSHRAIFGFGIGHVTKEGECQTMSGYTDEYIKDHPEELETLIKVGFECKTLEDCKKVAIAFARSVS